MHRDYRRPRRLFLTELECRATPAWTVSLIGTTVSFIGDNVSDFVTLSVASSKLSHNLTGQFGLSSQFDMDGATPGEQSILVAAITSLTVTGNGGTDTLTINDVPVPASISMEVINWAIVDAASAGADVTLTDSALTVTDVPMPYMYGISGMTSGRIDASATFAGDNLFDASAFTTGKLVLSGTSGDDTLRGGSGNDNLDGGDGTNTLIGGIVNGDRTVDGADFAGLGINFGSTISQPNFSAAFDYNGDGSIDGTDFAQFGARFGVTL